MKKEEKGNINRRDFLSSTTKASLGTALALNFPTIVPASVFGKNAPSNRINVASIGCGRISTSHDMTGIARYAGARIMAVCDLDRRRADAGPQAVRDNYKKATKENGGLTGDWDIKVYYDYKELLQNKDIDAVHISTPDHQHAIVAVHAVTAGKDVYLQKPASLTIEEGRILSNAVKKTGRILQMGSQQKSIDPWPQFKRTCELVRNGRIGKLQTIEVGLPGDPGGGNPQRMDVPSYFHYDAWLGATPEVYYTEDRVHSLDTSPKGIGSRPGWLRCEQFGAGMITGWGAHHIDTAHWAMGTEYSGPIEIWGHAAFPTDDPSYKGLWNVHGIFRTEALYANGVHMIVSNELPNGIKFIGSDGWIWVTRGAYRITDSDPVADKDGVKPIDASNPKILQSIIGANEIHLYESPEQHINWLDCVKSRKQPVAPIEIGHRSCSACLLHHIAMKLKRKIYWDPEKEAFKNGDKEATAMLSRPRRKQYDFNA
ncbi:Gfo/Idh/MocA family protein [Flavisolibacter ginsenosidimutans]|uniref:Gfo/Idh/MocA family oxidoreductase n=1 Tax=Flavisolibacter ginsenosidimutans TaxID=661481 RepID=A0A5B8UII4_9BACT|nr:Gfo/Idh/MocA family oxidoreductase [Flavisolibacter ginsenosidimutans]QEC56343.1 Gfo/Idh/MocA family oxidoreductase [Flavisolibacter ginsenosidimutans]